METTITLKQQFWLEFKVQKESVPSIKALMISNNFEVFAKRTELKAWYQFKVLCNVRQAEIIRQLLKNFKLYE